MKKSLMIIIAVFVIIAAWFGYKEIRRAVLLSSGEELLLIKDDKSAYVYSGNIIQDNIDRSWDVINKVTSLTPEKIAKRVDGIPPYTEQTIATIVKDFDVQIPDSDQAVLWQELLNQLTPIQKETCESIQSLNYGQFCLVTHYIQQLAKTNASQESCNLIFVEEYQADCKKALLTPDEIGYQDTNGNTVIDFFEEYEITPEESESFSETPGVIN